MEGSRSQKETITIFQTNITKKRQWGAELWWWQRNKEENKGAKSIINLKGFGELLFHKLTQIWPSCFCTRRSSTCPDGWISFWHAYVSTSAHEFFSKVQLMFSFITSSGVCLLCKHSGSINFRTALCHIALCHITLWSRVIA